MNGKYVMIHRQKLLLKISSSRIMLFLLAVPPCSFSLSNTMSPSTYRSFFYVISLAIDRLLLFLDKVIC